MAKRYPIVWTPQIGTQTIAFHCPCDEIFFGGTRGGLSPLYTKVLTPKGFVELGSLSLGQHITDPTTGGTTEVIGIYPQGEQDIYRFTFDDGAALEVGLDHYWVYRLANHIRPRTKQSAQRTFSQSELGRTQLVDRWNRYRIGKTRTLIELFNSGYGVRIPLSEPVIFTKHWRPRTQLPAYLIGLYLGDGYLYAASITNTDLDVLVYLILHGYVPDKKITWYARGEHRKQVRQFFSSHGLLRARSWEKFIPEPLLHSSVEDRTELLRGLLDTDGTVDRRGRVFFTSTSKQLAADVQWLVRSLGGKARLKSIGNPTYTYKGEKRLGRPAYTLRIWHPKTSALFNSSRKKERCTDSWNGGREITRELVDISYVGKRQAQCIRVSSPYGLYTADDFIVTHNSKTDSGIGRQIKKAYRYAHYFNGLMIRRKYKDFSKIRRRWDELIRMGLPARRVGGDNQINYIRFLNGAQVTLQAILFPDQADDLQGDEFQEITIDEGPTIPFISTLIDKLKGCCRSAHGVPCSIFVTGNPGGVGASQIAQMYIPKKDGGGAPVNEGEINYIEQKTQDDKIHKFTRVFIFSHLYDNKILVKNDPHYEARLRSIRNKELVDAWMDGKWTAIVGQAFKLTQRHIIPPVWPIPEHAPLYMTFDWGFGAPFSIGWWWVDGDDRIYRFAEWYGWNEISPNVGLRLTDREIAEGIVEREKKMGIWNRPINRLAGPDCFNKKPDYKGGGQGDTTADEFVKYAMDLRTSGKAEDLNATLTVWPGDPDRQRKIRQFRNRLRVPDDPKELPMLVVYDTCKDFTRLIATLCVDELTGEYLEDHQEDHCFDKQTEVLTEHGWRYFYNLTKDERVATLSKDGYCEWQLPYDYIAREYSGKMYACDGRINFMVTPKHRFPVISRHHRQLSKDNLWKHKEIQSQNDQWWIPRVAKHHYPTRAASPPLSGPHSNGNANNVANIDLLAFCRYYGFWLAEGCLCHYKTHYSVHVDQVNGGEDIVAALGYRYVKHTNNAGCTRYSINSAQFYNFMLEESKGAKAYGKFIPRWMLQLPKQYLEALYAGLMQGDGSSSNGRPVYNTSSKQLADDFQELLFRLGKVGNIKTYRVQHHCILGRPIRHTQGFYYRIHVSDRDTVLLPKGAVKTVDYTGKIYCLRVPNQTLYVRRTGTAYWSSNCFDEACHICMARPRGVPDEEVELTRAELEQKQALAKLDNVSRSATLELMDIEKQLERSE